MRRTGGRDHRNEVVGVVVWGPVGAVRGMLMEVEQGLFRRGAVVLFCSATIRCDV